MNKAVVPPRAIRVCFVCLGNICRSPTAEGIFRAHVARAGLADRIEIDSAGTDAYHVGEPPDRRSTQAAAARGVTLVGRARCWSAADFARFEYVVAMDRSNLEALQALARRATDHAAELSLLRDFDPDGPRGADVPDPYYGGEDGFSAVFTICQAACVGLLASLRQRHGL